jgi:hypothetical protein
VLPQEDLLVHVPLSPTSEPQNDYNKSHILTLDEFVVSLEAKAAHKQALLEEAQPRRIATEENKEMHRLEKLEKERRYLERAKERAAKKRERQYWDKVKLDGWGDKLHEMIKVNIQPERTPYNLSVPQVCRYNQKIAMLRAKFKEEGKDPRLVVPAMIVEPYIRIIGGFQPLNQSAWFMIPPTQRRCSRTVELLDVDHEQGGSNWAAMAPLPGHGPRGATCPVPGQSCFSLPWIGPYQSAVPT